MPRFTKAGAGALLAAFAACAIGGCRVSQESIERRHWEMNDSIRKTHNEQLLLNIVRVRYYEMPLFLQVSGITSQFSAQQGANVSGSNATGGNTNIGAGGSVGYSESPVVSWSVPESSEYLGRLLAPISADQLTVLAQAGWDPKRVFRVGVKQMNRVRNIDLESWNTFYTPASYDGFVEVLSLVGELRREGLVDLAYGVKSSVAAGNIPLDHFDSGSIADALPYGVQFMTRDDPEVFEVLRLSKPLFLRFSKASDGDPRAQRLRALLDLDDQRYSFGIVDTIGSGKEQLYSETGHVSQMLDPDAVLDEIVVTNRSIMEILYLASTYVQAPPEHIERGYTDAREPLSPVWLRIRSSQTEPADAWAKVQYRGYWYSIAGNDIESRESFTLLDAMFASVVGSVPGGTPLLTIPVR